MLDAKHANIGNTIGMVKEIHKLSNDPKLADEITLLFMEESNDCDYQIISDDHKLCTHGENSADPCTIGNCPLGKLFDDERNKGVQHFGNVPVDRMQLYGKNTMNLTAGLTRISHTDRRIFWNMFRKNLFHGWIDWLKTWPSYLFHNWKINLLIVIVVFAVYYGAALVGHIHGTYF
jgi:hypothetical protein